MPSHPGPQTVAAALPEPPQSTLGEVIRRNSAANTVLALVAVAAALHYAKLVFMVVCFSLLLAFVAEPLVVRLQRLRVPRNVAAFIALILLAAALCTLTFVSYSRAETFAEELPEYSATVRTYLSKYIEKTQKITQSAKNALPQPPGTRAVRVEQQTSVWDTIGAGLGTATEMAFSVSFIPFLAYFMLTWKDHARRSTVLLFPEDARATAYITLGTIADLIRAFIVGNVLVGLFIGALSTVVFGLIGIPYFYFVGFISGFLSLVPYLGVLIALLPPVLMGLGKINASGFLFIVLTVFGLHLVSLNVLYPKILGKRLQLNPLTVTLALLFWGWLWGAMGLVLAIPVTAALKVIIDNIETTSAFAAWLGE